MYKEKAAAPAGQTSAAPVRHALGLAQALATLAGEDRRPLLVLRECLVCNGTDNALLTRNADNERTLLMSRWFHCIKLPPDVLQDDHPFHALFAGEKPAHLFFADRDGSARKDLNGQQSRTELWDLMASYLVADYEKKADASLKPLLGLLDEFDRLDQETQSVRDQLDKLLEAGQAASPKAQKLRQKLADIEDARTKARSEAARLSELQLRETAGEGVKKA